MSLHVPLPDHRQSPQHGNGGPLNDAPEPDESRVGPEMILLLVLSLAFWAAIGFAIYEFI
jgi:hypothetical protein